MGVRCLSARINGQKRNVGLRCGSVAEHLPSMRKALGLIEKTRKTNTNDSIQKQKKYYHLKSFHFSQESRQEFILSVISF